MHFNVRKLMKEHYNGTLNTNIDDESLKYLDSYGCENNGCKLLIVIMRNQLLRHRYILIFLMMTSP